MKDFETIRLLNRWEGELDTSYSLGDFKKIYKDGKIIDEETEGKLKELVKYFLGELSVN